MFSELLPFENFGILKLLSPKDIGARDCKFRQLIVDDKIQMIYISLVMAL